MSEKDDKYFNMSEAYDDVKYGFGKREKALATTKLLGKGLFNTARYLLEEAIPAQKEKLEKMRDKNQ